MENNDRIQSVVFDFVAGNLPFDDFWPEFCSNSDLQMWFDTAGNFEPEALPYFKKGSLHWHYYNHVRNSFNGHALKAVPMFLADIPEKTHYDPKEKYIIYLKFEMVLLTIDSKVKRTKIYKQDNDYYEKAVNRSLDGPEVWRFIESILEQFPRTMKAADRVKAGRAAVQEAFHIQDRKFPCWPQEPEWPMGKNSPMEYLGRHKDGELVHLQFRDVDTGEKRIVEQFY